MTTTTILSARLHLVVALVAAQTLLSCPTECWCLSLFGGSASGFRSTTTTTPRFSSSFVVSERVVGACGGVGGESTSRGRRVAGRSVLVVTMGKGDGKKKRPKKKKSGASSWSSSASASSPPPSVPAPQRVSNLINVPVRRQIKYGKMRKEAEKAASTPGFRANNVKKTSYRKILDEEEIETARSLRRSLARDPDWDVILNSTAASPLVIVDGYNVIHKWPRLKKWMVKGSVKRARDTLVYDLEELNTLKGWRVEVVFDSGKRSTTGPLGDAPGDSVSTTNNNNNNNINEDDAHVAPSVGAAPSKTVTDHGVRVVYAGSADSYIESRCAAAREVTDGRSSGAFVVVSDDGMIRVAAGDAGAVAMGSGRLVDELKSVRRSTLHRVDAAVAAANGAPVVPPRRTDGATPAPSLFGRRQIMVEDRRRSKEERKRREAEEERRVRTETSVALQTVENRNPVPSWAVVPNETTTGR